MQLTTWVSWWKRLLLAFLATVVFHLLNTIAYTGIMLAHSDEPHSTFFRAGGEAQDGALFALLSGCFVLAAFLFVGAPLALFVPVRLQLRHWYGMLLGAALLPSLLFAIITADDLTSMVRKVSYQNWGNAAYPALCGMITCSLYLWLLRHTVTSGKSRRSASVNDVYKM